VVHYVGNAIRVCGRVCVPALMFVRIYCVVARCCDIYESRYFPVVSNLDDIALSEPSRIAAVQHVKNNFTVSVAAYGEPNSAGNIRLSGSVISGIF